jgi:hypothetical protein
MPTIKNYAKRRFIDLCDQMHKLVDAGLKTREQHIEFISLSLEIHSAKADVPKRMWRMANVHV